MITTLLGWIAASPWMRAALRYGTIALTVLLFLLALRRCGERTGRLAERLGTTERINNAQRRMLEAAARRALLMSAASGNVRPSSSTAGSPKRGRPGN